MIRMIKGNIERLVKTDSQKERLLALGYLVMEDENADVGKDIEADDNPKANEEAKADENSENIPLEEMTVAQLRNIAAKNNIGGCESMNKKALLESVRLLYKG